MEQKALARLREDLKKLISQSSSTQAEFYDRLIYLLERYIKYEVDYQLKCRFDGKAGCEEKQDE